MLVVVLISCVIITFIIEYYDDLKKRKRFIKSAQLAIKQTTKELRHIGLKADFPPIEILLINRFCNILHNNKPITHYEGKKIAKSKVKIHFLKDFKNSQLGSINLKKELQPDEFFFKKIKGTFYLLYCIKNFQDNMFVIIISKDKQQFIYWDYFKK